MSAEVTWPQVCPCVYFDPTEDDETTCECGHRDDEHADVVCLASVEPTS